MGSWCFGRRYLTALHGRGLSQKMICKAMSIRSFGTLLILLFGVWASKAVVLASFNGQNYLLLSQWAAANGFSAVTHDRGHQIVLTDDSTRLVFEADSAQAQINGI